MSVILAFSREGAMPTWALAVLFAVPVVIVLLVLRWAIPGRRARRRAQDSPLARRQEGIPAGSADALADGGQVPWANLLEALAVVPAGEEYDEAEGATMLGLRARVPLNTTDFTEPVVYWGVRDTRQVFIRLGIDEAGEGMPLTSNKRLLECTVVRAAFPPFALAGKDGVLSVDPRGGPAPPEVAAFVATLAPSPDVWRKLRVVAGPDGIVAVRPQWDDILGGWIYDLWLAERLVAVLGAEPLVAARIGPSWKVPYDLGRRGRSL